VHFQYVVSSVGLLDLRSTPVVPMIPTDVLVRDSKLRPSRRGPVDSAAARVATEARLSGQVVIEDVVEIE
jgi:hypothetical protein